VHGGTERKTPRRRHAPAGGLRRDRAARSAKAAVEAGARHRSVRRTISSHADTLQDSPASLRRRSNSRPRNASAIWLSRPAWASSAGNQQACAGRTTQNASSTRLVWPRESSLILGDTARSLQVGFGQGPANGRSPGLASKPVERIPAGSQPRPRISATLSGASGCAHRSFWRQGRPPGRAPKRAADLCARAPAQQPHLAPPVGEGCEPGPAPGTFAAPLGPIRGGIASAAKSKLTFSTAHAPPAGPSAR